MAGTATKQNSSNIPRLLWLAESTHFSFGIDLPKHLMLSDEKEDLLNYCEFTIHHRLRAEWARISGLLELINAPHSEQDHVIIKELLKKSLDEMDNAMREVSQKLFTRDSHS